jgi:hypothetical protein
VDEVDVAAVDELGGAASRAASPHRIRRTPIEHRRPAASGHGKRAIRNELRVEPGIYRFGVDARIGRRRRDESDLDAALDQRADQIEDVAFESAVSVQRKHRTRENGDSHVVLRASSR